MRVAPVLTAISVLVLAAPVWADGEDESRWNALREMLFQDRPIHDGAEILALDAPYRAHDAAVVPISIELAFPQTEERHIKTVTLLIDENPLPVAGRFHFTPASGRASLSTRVRVNAYTNIRAIAETSDGKLYMTKRYVKATGGCSAPAGKDPDAALARLGKMKVRQSDALVLGEPNLAQLLISHPNHTGMQMDQVTHLYVPAHFVNNIEVRFGGRAGADSRVRHLSERRPEHPLLLHPRGARRAVGEGDRQQGSGVQRHVADAGSAATGGCRERWIAEGTPGAPEIRRRPANGC